MHTDIVPQAPFHNRYQLISPPDGAWGKRDENGTWSGLVGHALYGKSNWSASGIGVTPEVNFVRKEEENVL